MINYGFFSTSTSNISSKPPGYCMFPDWYSKNAPVIQLLLIVLGVKVKGDRREGLINFLLQKGQAY